MLMYLTKQEKEIQHLKGILKEIGLLYINRPFLEQLKEIKVKYNITDYSEKLVKLMVPSWDFEMDEDLINKSVGYFKEDL